MRPPPPERRSSQQSDHEPWILESCRDCLESAALLIYVSGISLDEPVYHRSGEMEDVDEHWSPERTWRSWCDIQLLFAAYLILLQAKSAPALMPVFRNVGEVDGLLDRVERIFESLAVQSVKVEMSLAILRNERHNFDVASPDYSHMSA